MSITSADLWRLLRQSRLLPPERLAQVREAFSQAGNEPSQVPAKALAHFLVQRELLTPYQAKLLLNGRTGPFRYGAYQIQDRITRRRLSNTFLAVHTPSRCPVLLKFAANRVAQDPRQWNAARRYIRSISPVVHDQLQRVYALEEQAGYRFLVLEPLTGTSLDTCLTRRGPLPVSEACRIARLAACGLAAIHQTGQTHGEVRPENLWLATDDNAKLLRDRLLPPVVPAIWLDSAVTTDELQADYLAPELAHPGVPLSAATDLYALGCTLYQLLAGRPPFRGDGIVERMRRHATEPVPLIVAQAVPDDLMTVLEQLLAKDPSARVADAKSAAELLEPFVEASQLAIPTSIPTPEQLALDQALQHPAAPPPPAPPVVIPEADDRPPVPEPPVQSGAVPIHMAQEILAETVEPPANTPAPLPQTNGDPTALPTRRPRAAGLTRRQRMRRKQAVVLSAIAVTLLLIAVAVVASNARLRESILGRDSVASVTSRDTPPQKLQTPAASRAGEMDSSRVREAAGYEVRQDDGKMLWMPPSTGSAIELRHLAAGAQLILVSRPHDALQSPQGPQVLRALGPEFEALRQLLENTTSVPLNQMKQLVVALYPTTSDFAVTATVELLEPQPLDALLAAWGNPSAETYGDNRYYRGTNWSYFAPAADEGTVREFVMGNEDLVREIMDAGDEPPLLRRELAILWQNSDRERHVSLLFVPEFVMQQVLTARRNDVLPHMQPLREALTWLVSGDVQACLISAQIADTFYVELRAYGHAGADSSPIAAALRERVNELPEAVESLIAGSYPSVYWRRVALRYPEMIRFLQRHTRSGVEADQAVVNAVLPAVAAHNLVFGAMMLAQAVETPAVSDPGTAVIEPRKDLPDSLETLLQERMTVSFAQQSLEFAIEDLAQQVREAYPDLTFPFELKILGADLQLNGITRNQQISQFIAEDQTIAEILTALVVRVNPGSTAVEPSSSEQKLIWVIGPDPDKPETRILLITTRDAAQRRSYQLSAPFHSK